MNNSRRSFIKNSSIIVAGTALAPHNYTFKNDDKVEEKVSIQLFSLDKEMNNNAPKTLKALKEIGYNYVEHADYSSRKFYGYSPRDFKTLLKDNGLNLSGGHTVLKQEHWNKAANDFTEEWHNTINDAVEAEQQYIITPWLDRSLWNNEPELKKFLEILNKSGELCNKASLRFGYHNHDFEFTHYINSLTLYNVILKETDADLVTQQLDIGNSGMNSILLKTLFDKYPGRFFSMHVKDVTASGERHRQHKSTTIGDGILDVPEIVEHARRKGGTCNFTIDQNDFSGVNPLDCAQQNYTAFNNIIKADINKIKTKIA